MYWTYMIGAGADEWQLSLTLLATFFPRDGLAVKVGRSEIMSCIRIKNSRMLSVLRDKVNCIPFCHGIFFKPIYILFATIWERF